MNITGTDGTIIRFIISTYTSTTVVKGHPNKTVPVSMRSVATTDWALAVDEVTGLWHLEGEDVSVFADGFVVASPNNASIGVLTVANGTIILDRPYGLIHVGLPITADLETLDIDSTASEPLIDKHKNISRVYMTVEESRGVWAGGSPPSDDDTDPLEGLNELKIRDDETYDDPVTLATDVVSIDIQPEWNSNGRVFIRQVDPVPLSILSIAPSGKIPYRRPGSQ